MRLIIVGHSMEPFILAGSNVLVSNIPFIISKPKIGDIIAFQKENKVFIKRVVKISGGKYFVKGDNSKDSLKIGWIDKKGIVGKVIGKI